MKCHAICCTKQDASSPEASFQEGEQCRLEAEKQYNGVPLCWVHHEAIQNPLRTMPLGFVVASVQVRA
jgi:hypothetical protein